MVPPDDNSFEIARRLDEYGAGKSPQRPPRDRAPTEEKPIRKARRSGSRRIRGILWLLAIGLAVYWWFSIRTESTPSGSPQGHLQSQIPRSKPPQTIPARDGEGTVPAFTVQILGQSTPSSKSPDVPKDPRERTSN